MPVADLIRYMAEPINIVKFKNQKKKKKKSPVFPDSSRDEGRLPCFAWKGMLTSPSHLERRLVST